MDAVERLNAISASANAESRTMRAIVHRQYVPEGRSPADHLARSRLRGRSCCGRGWRPSLRSGRFVCVTAGFIVGGIAGTFAGEAVDSALNDQLDEMANWLEEGSDTGPTSAPSPLSAGN